MTIVSNLRLFCQWSSRWVLVFLIIAVSSLCLRQMVRKRDAQLSPYLYACMAIDNDSVPELERILSRDPHLVVVRDGFDKSTLLHRVSASSRGLHNCEELAKSLVSHGADINALDATGSTPIMIALQFSAPDNYVEFLQRVSQQVNTQEIRPAFDAAPNPAQP